MTLSSAPKVRSKYDAYRTTLVYIKLARTRFDVTFNA